MLGCACTVGSGLLSGERIRERDAERARSLRSRDSERMRDLRSSDVSVRARDWWCASRERDAIVALLTATAVVFVWITAGSSGLAA